MALAKRWIPEHRTDFKAKNFFKPKELLHRRQVHQLEVRKRRREDIRAKRRGIGGLDELHPVSSPWRLSEPRHQKVPNEMRFKPYKYSQSALVKIQHTGSFINIVNLPFFVPLLRLPPELRLCIYEYALQCDEDKCEISETTGVPEPALLMTCKAIRSDAISVFYSVNTFKMVIQSYSASMSIFMGRKITTLKEQYGCVVRKLVKEDKGAPRWHNLVRWLRLAHQNDIPCLIPALGPNRGARWNPAYPRYYKEQNVVTGFFEMVCQMRSIPWDRVEDTFSLMRYGLAQFDPEWDQD